MHNMSIIDNENCTGWGICQESYSMDTILDEKGKVIIGTDWHGCGRCSRICSHHSIDVIINDKLFVENIIKAIEQVID